MPDVHTDESVQAYAHFSTAFAEASWLLHQDTLNLPAALRACLSWFVLKGTQTSLRLQSSGCAVTKLCINGMCAKIAEVHKSAIQFLLESCVTNCPEHASAMT